MIGKLVKMAIFGALGAILVKLMITFDVNKRVYNHSPGPCKQVKGIKHGSEDIAMVERDGLAFISSGINYMSHRSPEVKGHIFLYDFNDNKSEPEAVPLKITGDIDLGRFRPHGISHWLLPGGGVRLFVINHATPDFSHSVEVFDFDAKKRVLNHVKSIKNDKFIRPNDLVAVGADSFILTNDGSAQNALSNMVELLAGYAAGSIVYHDGKASHWLLKRGVSPNGVILSKDGSHLIVSHFYDEIIAIYKLNKDYKSMDLVAEHNLMTSSDNFYMDSDGAVWTSAHPVLKDSLDHLKECDDLSKHGPSQILRLSFSPDWKECEVVEVLADDGRRLSGSSVAVHFKNQLLLGTVCRQMLHCHIAHPAVIQ